LFKGYQELQSGFHLFQHGEMLIIRLIYLYEGPSPDDLVKKITNNVEEKEQKNESIKIKSPNNETPATINKVIETEKSGQVDNVAKLSNSIPVKSFRQFADLFYQKKEGMLHTYLYNNVKLVSFKEGEIVINSEDIADPHFCRTIAKYISKWTGRIWQVSSSSSNLGKTLQEEDLFAQQKEIEIMKNDPQVKQILNKYPGAKIHSITDIQETLDETIASKDIKQSIKEK
jgi:DNA polymerase-3 subunit gamma/tau